MKVLIVGLGLIGGSYAKGLSQKGYEVYGVDKNIETIEFAMNSGYVLDASIYPEDYLQIVDMVILTLYPEDILPFLNRYKYLFKPNLVITDTCGIKANIVKEATSLALPANFVGSHPMAGKEKVGIKFADPEIFKKGNYLLTVTNDTDLEATLKVKEIALALEFKNIYMMSPEEHDKMIAYTSQLTHAIAVALVNSENNLEVEKYIGDSYRDLTRIAMINEGLWMELFKNNKNNLVEEIDKFIDELNKIKTSLTEEDYAKLIRLFKSSKMKRGALN